MKKYSLKDILIPIACFAAIAGLLIYIFMTILSIMDNFSKVSQYSDNIAIYQNNIVKLQGISKSDLDQKVLTESKSIPEGGDVANLVNDTINLAKSFGLDAEKDAPAATTTSTTSQTDGKKAVDVEELQSGDIENVPQNILIDGLVYPINLSITVKGSKENILNFMQNVSKQDRISNVAKITLSQSSNKDTADFWIGKVSIFSYTVAAQKADTRTVVKITDPLDSKLLTTPKILNTNF